MVVPDPKSCFPGDNPLALERRAEGAPKAGPWLGLAPLLASMLLDALREESADEKRIEDPQ